MKYLTMLALILFSFFLTSCGKVSDGSGTSAGNPVVTGEVHHKGKPCKNVFIFIESSDFIDTMFANDSYLPDTSFADGKSDSLGRFTIIAPVKSDNYRIEFYSPSIYEGAVCDISEVEQRGGSAEVVLPIINLSHLYDVKGILAVNGDSSNFDIDASVFVKGFNRSVNVNDEGEFYLVFPKCDALLDIHSSMFIDKHPDTIEVDKDLYIEEEVLSLNAISNGYVCDTLIARELLDKNCMTNIPADSILSFSGGRASKIKIFGADFSILPEVIGGFRTLQEVQIEYTDIRELPERIGELTTITELEIKNNKLTTLPASVINLDNLKELDLGYNYLKNLAPDVKKWADKYDPNWQLTQK